MIPIYEISDEELSVLKYRRIAQNMESPSYTQLWCTPDGKRLLKLFSTNETVWLDCSSDIENDISTLLSLSGASCSFDSRFVLPDIIYTQQSRVIGYAMPYVRGKTLSKTEFIPVREFKKIVRQLYDDVLFINTETQFSFADLHEDNIILDANNGVHHVDADGWYCGNWSGRRSRYLTFQREKLASCAPKYKLAKGTPYFVPDLNSDLFCLIHIILNYLIDTDFFFVDLSEDLQESYIKYLKEFCPGAGIARMYDRLFSCENNIIDIQAIQDLPDDIGEFSYHAFIKHTSRFKTEDAAEDYLRRNEIRLNRLVPGRELKSI